jgi:hypothetical protein
MRFGNAPAPNYVVAASGRLRRPPEYTARILWCDVGGGGVVWRNMADHRSCSRRVGNL